VCRTPDDKSIVADLLEAVGGTAPVEITSVGATNRNNYSLAVITNSLLFLQQLKIIAVPLRFSESASE